MSTIVAWLISLSTLEGIGAILSYPARFVLWLLRRRKGGIVRGVGVEFFSGRMSLEREYGKLSERLKTASKVSAIWVIGQKFYHARQNLSVVKELLLPNPDGVAFRYYLDSCGHAETASYIRDTTRLAHANGAKVRWYEPFIFQSINLVDTDKPTGWAHIEIVLPYSKIDERPSFTFYKRYREEIVSDLQRIFDEIWHSAKDAPRD